MENKWIFVDLFLLLIRNVFLVYWSEEGRFVCNRQTLYCCWLPVWWRLRSSSPGVTLHSQSLDNESSLCPHAPSSQLNFTSCKLHIGIPSTGAYELDSSFAFRSFDCQENNLHRQCLHTIRCRIWKIANQVSFHQDSGSFDLDNYRPTSLFPAWPHYWNLQQTLILKNSYQLIPY